MFKSLSRSGWTLVALLLGACSMSYELLLAKMFGEIIGNEVLCQSVTVGTYLLGLGWGAWRASSNANYENVKIKIIHLELQLAVLGCFAPVLVMALITVGKYIFPVSFLIADDNPTWQMLVLLILQPLPLWIGLWSGWELPLVIQLSGEKTATRILAGSYLGGLVGSWFVPWSGFAHLTVAQSAWLVGLMNWLVAFVLIFVLLKVRLRGLIQIALAWVLMFATVLLQAPVQRAYLTLHYGNYGLGKWNVESLRQIYRLVQRTPPVQRVVSSYQNIDLVDESFFTRVGRTGAFTMYLNRKPQFSADTFHSYHQSMVYGALNLAAQKPSEVVILGGGDGLIAAELLRLPFIKKITLIELDPEVLRLARTDFRLLQLNQGSLSSPRVEVVVGDAFHFLRQLKQPLKAVFIDFPYPESFDTTKLFSREFFTVLQTHLAIDGFAVMDAPFWRDLNANDEPRPWPQDLLQSTLVAAGVNNYLLYGPIEPFLFIPSRTQPQPHFDYDKFPQDLDPRALVNLTDINHYTEDTLIRPEYVNSIFKPRRWR